jgi:hypothetical protein
MDCNRRNQILIIKYKFMKKVSAFLGSILVGSMAHGQALLPASWNFDDLTPTGWTESLDNVPGNTRYTTGQVNAACKLDGDDEYVEVFFNDVCGGVTYYIKGQGSAVANDIFTIQESANGSTWTTMRELVGSQIDNNAYVQYTDAPAAGSRYIRWYFTEKQSGRNVALDEISLIAQVPTNAQEIAVNASGSSVVNGATLLVGNAATTAMTIENVNLAAGSSLNISSLQITGPNASEFTLSGISAPAVVSAASNVAFTLNFSTVAQGSRFATLTIGNNDANGDESTYVINLYGIGGNYATEPTAQPSNVTFTNVTSYGYDASFSAANPSAEKYIVLRGINTTTLAQPQDGMTYVKGDYLDASTQVVYVGAAGSFRPSYNVASTAYTFHAYSFNGEGGYENYLTSGQAISTANTLGNMMGGYYAGVNPSSGTFLADLQDRISSPYDQTFYSNYAPIVINKFASRDTTGGQKVVTDVYSGFQYMYSGSFFWDVLSREHSWPHSWMPTFPDEEGLEYSDLFNLFPVHQDNANAVRSNRPLGEVVDVTSTFLDATYGLDASGKIVYEPRDQHKGDAARAIMYMAVKWNGTGGTWELPNPIDFLVQYGQDQEVLKAWHWQDPPSDWEIARNDFIQSEQGNRNPFVDSVNWVCYIDFETLTHLPQPNGPCEATSIDEAALLGSLSIAPNPTAGDVTLTFDLKQSELLQVDVLDVAGKRVFSTAVNAPQGTSRHTVDVASLSTGIYMMQVKGATAQLTQKLVVR